VSDHHSSCGTEDACEGIDLVESLLNSLLKNDIDRDFAVLECGIR
jgi:hypothetical protein